MTVLIEKCRNVWFVYPENTFEIKSLCTTGETKDQAIDEFRKAKVLWDNKYFDTHGEVSPYDEITFKEI